jgi:hypothetical protein
MNDGSRIKILKYSRSYKHSVLELLKYMWKNLKDEEIDEKYEWRYNRNPYSGENYIYIAISGEKVIGFRSLVAQKFIFKGEYIDVFSPSDTIVHPDFRRMGIISQLNKKCTDLIYNSYPAKSTILLNTSTSTNSMPVYLKQGWEKTIYKKKNGFKICFRNMLKSKLNRSSLFDDKENNIRRGSLLVSKDLRIDELVSINERLRPHKKIINARDTAYYEWRYSYGLENYINVYYKTDSNLKGYMILRQASDYQYVVEETLAQNSKTMRLMIDEIIRYLGIPVLRMLVSNKEDEIEYKKMGFFIESEKLINLLGNKQFPLLIRPILPQPKEDDFFIDRTDLRDTVNWSISNADIH